MRTILNLIRPFREKYQTPLYYVVPIAMIILISFMTNFFVVNEKVINKDCLWDMAGRPYKTFLYELNLPKTVGAVFVGGTPDNLVKTEKYYNKVNIGDIYTSQLRSLLCGTRITEYSIASYINFIFGISAILFAILAGYLILKNGYASIAIFAAIVVFRNLSPGLIYGLPLRHAYAVFNPLIAFFIAIFIILYLKDDGKKYLPALMLSGFAIAYIAHCRTSEGQIIMASLSVFSLLMLIEYWRLKKKEYGKLLAGITIVFAAIYAGYSGYYAAVSAFENHRDKKLHFPPAVEKVLSSQPAFHSLYTGLYRYSVPNNFGDKIGYDAFYEKYPELMKDHLNDVDYTKLAVSNEYNKAIRDLYFEFIINNPNRFLVYLGKSVYDYFLFLPYYSWSGNKSAHAYLPKINNNVIIDRNDLAPDFKDSSFNWILNLKLKYLPKSPLFWLYFISAYALLLNAVYTAITFTKKNHELVPAAELIESNLPIYLLRGMLIYFFFASVVRVLIPVHGQGAVVAFNVVIVYNMVRLVVTMRNREVKTIMKRTGIVLLFGLLLFSVMGPFRLTGNAATPDSKTSRNHNKGWNAYKSSLSLAQGGRSGKCMQITTTGNATGYVYAAVPTTVGETYKFTGYYKRGSADNGQIKIGNTVDNPGIYYSGVLSDIKWKKLECVFKASSNTTYITLVDLTSAKGKTSFFDGISLQTIRSVR